MALDRQSFRGIFVIVVTPFTPRLDVDEEALGAVLELCFRAGVHGVVATANASEVGYLSEAERRRVAEIVVSAAKGRAASIVGVSTSHYLHSAALARHAEAIGADAVMAMPPTFHTPGAAEIEVFYHELAAATDLPIVLQNGAGLGYTTMSAPMMARLVNDIPTVRFIKEETNYAAQLAGEVLGLAGKRLEGVMGGRAGRTLMEEMRHGVCGTMPACEVADVHMALWHAIEANDDQRARHIFRRLLPLLDLESTYGVALCKEVLHRRGIIAHPGWRQTGLRPLDGRAREEAARLLDDVADFMLPGFSHVA